MEGNQNQGYGVQSNVAPQEQQVGYGVQTPTPLTQQTGYGQAPAGTPSPASEKKPLDWRIIAAIVAVVIIIVIIIILLTGGKKLTCTGKMYGLDAEMTFKFDGDKAKSADVTMTLDYKKYDLEKEDVEEDMDEFVEQYEENGVKVSYKIGDSEAKITMSMDKLSEEFEDFDGKKYDEVKELLEDSSFKCE